MKQVTIIDDHPGKYHDGMKLVLARYVITYSLHDPNTHSGICGVRMDPSIKRGMFGEKEVIQDMEKIDDKWHFTMSNITDISRWRIDDLLEIGHHTMVRSYDNGEIYFTLVLNLM